MQADFQWIVNIFLSSSSSFLGNHNFFDKIPLGTGSSWPAAARTLHIGPITPLEFCFYLPSRAGQYDGIRRGTREKKSINRYFPLLFISPKKAAAATWLTAAFYIIRLPLSSKGAYFCPSLENGKIWIKNTTKHQSAVFFSWKWWVCGLVTLQFKPKVLMYVAILYRHIFNGIYSKHTISWYMPLLWYQIMHIMIEDFVHIAQLYCPN